jgi:hypothetical protein
MTRPRRSRARHHRHRRLLDTAREASHSHDIFEPMLPECVITLYVVIFLESRHFAIEWPRWRHISFYTKLLRDARTSSWYYWGATDDYIDDRRRRHLLGAADAAAEAAVLPFPAAIRSFHVSTNTCTLCISLQSHGCFFHTQYIARESHSIYYLYKHYSKHRQHRS